LNKLMIILIHRHVRVKYNKTIGMNVMRVNDGEMSMR